MTEVIRHFLPELLLGFLVNLQIAFGAVMIGLCIGVPMAVARDKLPRSGRVVWAGVRLLQAAPTYVIMFFALSVLPRDFSLFGIRAAGIAAVILSQSAYLTAYIAENFHRALQHLHRNERGHALLFLPNLLRGFFVVVMSSGFGAAIGVSEAVGVTMREAEQLHSLDQRIALFVIAIALFVAVYRAANVLIRFLVRRLSAGAGSRSLLSTGPGRL
jgi:ABC-type amino acid transport system permease subunit